MTEQCPGRVAVFEDCDEVQYRKQTTFYVCDVCGRPDTIADRTLQDEPVPDYPSFGWLMPAHERADR